MNPKLLKTLRGLYEPLLVLLVVGAAGLLFYSLVRALGGGRGPGISFDAAFDDVSGIKERSSVLFKGMPVGTVGAMRYDPATDKILVRIDLKKSGDIPASIKPYVESSLMGQSNIALRTEGASGQVELLAAVVGRHSKDHKSPLYRLEGVRLSRADSIMPGLDAKARDAMTIASDALEETKELAALAKESVASLNKEVESIVLAPVRELADGLREFIKGPEGQSDKGLAAEVQAVLDQIEGHSKSLDRLFNGDKEQNTTGLVQLTESVSTDWRSLSSALLDGKDKALKELTSLARTLDKAGQAVSRSETHIKKLGDASARVDGFIEVLRLKPSSIIWGMNDKQRALMDQQRPGSQPPGRTGR